jgi:pyruvate/2-oxoglutarate dehydrogenase complex dihydrolipoamide acyltransferase (E2) component
MASGEDRQVALTPLRRMTIERLVESQRAAVPVTVMTEARAEALLRIKRRWEGHRPRVTVTVLLAKVLAEALMASPEMNATLTDDDIVQHGSVHLGIAVARPDGNLMVPVLHHAAGIDIPALAAAVEDLVTRARANKLGLADVRGGVFTLSNVGVSLAPLRGTPILPPGHSGILLTSGIATRPVIENGGVTAGQVLDLSLTFDHRVINGMPALAFLERVKMGIEEPASWVEDNTDPMEGSA